MLFAERVEAVAIGACRDSQQAAVVVCVPGKQRRVLRQQSLQPLAVIVVNDTPSLRHRPLQPGTETFADFGGEIPPAWVAVLTREDAHGLSPGAPPGSVREDRSRTGRC